MRAEAMARMINQQTAKRLGLPGRSSLEPISGESRGCC